MVRGASMITIGLVRPRLGRASDIKHDLLSELQLKRHLRRVYKSHSEVFTTPHRCALRTEPGPLDQAGYSMAVFCKGVARSSTTQTHVKRHLAWDPSRESHQLRRY